jgi:NAD(P)-dependent dehydrogenase (short-subunit alcohol dehydrogenase family)
MVLEKITHSRSTEKLRAEIDLTVFGPLTLVREFLPLIRKSPAGKIMFVSSQLGSIEIGFHMVNVCNSYGIAKAGLNM